MAFSIKGIHIPHRKNTAGMSAVRMLVPSMVTIPMAMHIGKPAKPIVKVGDSVSVGTMIAEQDGMISSPVYSSVSGTVKGIADIVISNGRRVSAITIESDGEMTPDDTIKAPQINSKEDFIEAVKMSGIVGLGGAGFPTYVKFATDKKIDTLVINGAECEPYITSDSVTMVDRADEILFAIETADKYFNFEKVIIGIEKNKTAAITSMKNIAAKYKKIEVKVLPSVYPQGGEKVLIYNTTGRVVAAGKLPADVGCIVCNSSTMANIARYIKTGMPLVEKIITVDGGAVKEPKNVIAPIGTSLADVFDFCGGFVSEPMKVLYGGPMMGIAVPELSVPVLKQTNAILALNEKETRTAKTTACIRCGKCTNSCPFGINPAAIAKAYKDKDAEMLEKLGADVCMLCGCCSYICPAKRPLAETNSLAKNLLMEERAKKKEVKA
ncbi:MAG: electron transport complex subunit RsxC [Clostridia bacterium]|nr:electron transport complex subunit RsxC [Clostridia bacterium]